MEPTIDDYDRRLLALVQEDATASADELSQHIPLSPSAIQRRLKRLREDGVIERHTAVLDPSRLGGLTFFMAFLHVAHEHPPAANSLKDWISHRPEVQQAWYVTGDDDFVLLVCAPGVEAYEQLMRELMRTHPHVLKYTTRVVLSPVKRGLSLPLRP